MCNFWPKKWSRSLKKFEWWSLTRELLKQYFTRKQNGCLRSGRLREVVAMRELTVLQFSSFVGGGWECSKLGYTQRHLISKSIVSK